MKKNLLSLGLLLMIGGALAQTTSPAPTAASLAVGTTCTGATQMTNMDDLSRITQVVLHERQGRDRGWWAQMRDCYWPDSLVKLTWFTGPGPEFVTRSEAMVKGGSLSVHRLGPPVIQLSGNRALVEVSAAIEAPTVWQGVNAYLSSYCRIFYRVERRGDEWRIMSLDTIYERDTLTPSVPGEVVKVDPKSLEGKRQPYALLALLLEQRGFPVGNDQLGDDQPQNVAAFYDGAFRWLNGN